MNIILISRNIKKLKFVAESIEKDYNVNTKIVQCDFSDSLEPGFFDKIMKEIGDLDISIWINNVGIAKYSKFHELDKKDVKNCLVVNTFPQMVFSKIMIPKLLKRERQSALIDLSSIA